MEIPTVVSGAAPIEGEQEAGLSGEHRLSTGAAIQDVEANVTQATDTVTDAVPKAETPGGDEQTREEGDSDDSDDSSSANSTSDTLANGIDDVKGADRNLNSDSSDDSDGDFFIRYQPRGKGNNGFSGRLRPSDSSPKPPTTQPPGGQPTAPPTARPQEPAATGSRSGRLSQR